MMRKDQPHVPLSGREDKGIFLWGRGKVRPQLLTRARSEAMRKPTKPVGIGG